jgi:hypothetical protein
MAPMGWGGRHFCIFQMRVSEVPPVLKSLQATNKLSNAAITNRTAEISAI